MRRGTAGSNAALIDLVFAGDQNSTFTLGNYDTNSNQLFRVEVAKTNGARVILGNNVAQDNSSLATLTFTSGYIQTNQYRFTVITNNSTVIVGGSPASYVIGELARSLPTSGTTQYSRDFPVGDAAGYRPVTLYSTQRPSGRQQMGARVVPGPANTGTSTLQGGLTAVSPRRYYAFTYYFDTTNEPITIDRVEPTYGADDNVPSGSTNFVVAASTNNRATWTNAGGFNTDGTTPHTTTLAAPPTAIQSGNLTGFTFTFTLSGTTIVQTTNYATIGTTAMFTAGEDAPETTLAGLTSAPNPTAGVTALRVSLDAAAEVSLGVYDVLGRRVATVVDGPLTAGDHAFSWDARGVAPGVYVVRLQTGGATATRMVTVTR